MSEKWEFYPCQAGDHIAYIFYDHGLSKEIDDLDCNRLLKIQLQLKNTNEYGLPADEEYEALTQVEDEIDAVLDKHDGISVGRITVAGVRIFYIYADIAEETLSAIVTGLAEKTGYEMRYTIKDDPQKDGYWNDLFPTDIDWRLILDTKMIQSLLDSNDNLDTQRQIEHYAYFESLDALQQFSDWAKSAGYQNFIATVVDEEDLEDGDELKHRLFFTHFGTTQLNDINEHTTTLMERAEEYKGMYDSWDTKVMN